MENIPRNHIPEELHMFLKFGRNNHSKIINTNTAIYRLEKEKGVSI
jgi:hypothetical protein